MEDIKIELKLSMREVTVLLNLIRNAIPAEPEDEMIASILYTRISLKLEQLKM